MLDPFKTCRREQRLHLADRITFPLRDLHEQRGVFGDVERAGFLGIDERVVNDEQAAGRERGVLKNYYEQPEQN